MVRLKLNQRLQDFSPFSSCGETDQNPTQQTCFRVCGWSVEMRTRYRKDQGGEVPLDRLHQMPKRSVVRRPKCGKCKIFLYFYGSLDTRSMKYECALGNGPLGCSMDEQGRKTICSCDADLCNIGKGLSTYQCIRFVQSGSLCRTSNRVQGRQRSCGEKATLSAGSLAMQKR